MTANVTDFCPKSEDHEFRYIRGGYFCIYCLAFMKTDEAANYYNELMVQQEGDRPSSS
tara:strand:+ start:696 stop:869 length:174 start_codon:yes stop_codon:yes gene_type:complete